MNNRLSRNFLLVWMSILGLVVVAAVAGPEGVNDQTPTSVLATQENRRSPTARTVAATQDANNAEAGGGAGITTQDGNNGRTYSIEAVVLVVLVFCLLAFLFWLLLRWSHRLDQASYLGEIYKESVEDFERKRLAGGYTEKYRAGGYHNEVEHCDSWVKEHKKPLPPPGSGAWTNVFAGDYPRRGRTTLDDPDRNMRPLGSSSEAPSGEQRADYDDYRAKIETWHDEVDAEARKRYQKDLDDAENLARERAGRAIDVDLSALRGRGAEFVLEFTTVVVIIFTAIVLGILHILDNQQIGTLLAAIAGYVLGRATTRGRSTVSEAPTKNQGKQTAQQ